MAKSITLLVTGIASSGTLRAVVSLHYIEAKALTVPERWILQCHKMKCNTMRTTKGDTITLLSRLYYAARRNTRSTPSTNCKLRDDRNSDFRCTHRSMSGVSFGCQAYVRVTQADTVYRIAVQSVHAETQIAYSDSVYGTIDVLTSVCKPSYKPSRELQYELGVEVDGNVLIVAKGVYLALRGTSRSSTIRFSQCLLYI
eukprot:9604-Heterococcus_DN1.PRE.19